MNDRSIRKTTAAKSFGESADGYLNSRTHSEGDDLESLASWCDGATRALDIATGAGHTAGALLDTGVPSVIAADASRSMVETSVASFLGVRGVVADAERLPFEADAFDAVTCRIAAHHLPDPEAFVREVARVIRPGGVFAFEDNVAPEDDELGSFINRLERMRDPTHVESYRTSAWHEWMADAGFTVERTEHLMKRIPYAPWIDRIGSLDTEEKTSVHQHLLCAPNAAVEFFEIEYDGDSVDSFGSLKALIRAERTG